MDRFEQQQHKVASTHKWRRWTNGRGEEVPSAPELDPRAGAQALTLLLGGFAMISSRKRKNTPSV